MNFVVNLDVESLLNTPSKEQLNSNVDGPTTPPETKTEGEDKDDDGFATSKPGVFTPWNWDE